jgi:hypothetical protein
MVSRARSLAELIVRTNGDDDGFVTVQQPDDVDSATKSG